MLDFQFPTSILNGLSFITAIIGNLVLIYIATPWLAISAPFMAVGYWFLVKFYLVRSLWMFYNADSYGFFLGYFEAITTVRSGI